MFKDGVDIRNDLSLKCWHCHQAKTRYDLRETGPDPGGHDEPIQDDLFTTAR